MKTDNDGGTLIPDGPPPNTHHILRALVAKVSCKPGWSFRLKDEKGALRLVITVVGPDSRPVSHPQFMGVAGIGHYRPVPMAEYNEATWKEWLFKCCQDVENHELGEWFKIGDEQPFLPLHGPGEDPYTVHFSRPPIDVLTTQDGSVREPYRTAERDPTLERKTLEDANKLIIAERLAALYDPIKASLWMNMGHQQLMGRTPQQAIDAGRADEVIAILDRRESDSYL